MAFGEMGNEFTTLWMGIMNTVHEWKASCKHLCIGLRRWRWQ